MSSWGFVSKAMIRSSWPILPLPFRRLFGPRRRPMSGLGDTVHYNRLGGWAKAGTRAVGNAECGVRKAESGGRRIPDVIGPYALRTLLSALCTLLSALCSLHSALCSLHSALCSLLS